MSVSLITIIYIFTVPPFLSLTGKLKCEKTLSCEILLEPKMTKGEHHCHCFTRSLASSNILSKNESEFS